jgi:hypothetical protein
MSVTVFSTKTFVAFAAKGVKKEQDRRFILETWAKVVGAFDRVSSSWKSSEKLLIELWVSLQQSIDWAHPEVRNDEFVHSIDDEFERHPIAVCQTEESYTDFNIYSSHTIEFLCSCLSHRWDISSPHCVASSNTRTNGT